MRFNEIFPRAKFPLRAKTKVKIPETDLMVRISVFYQKPPLAFHDPQQICGVCGVYGVVSLEKEELLAEAVLVEKNPKRFRSFMCKMGDWVDITDDDNEIEKMMRLEKLLLGPRVNGYPFGGLENAEWKSF